MENFLLIKLHDNSGYCIVHVTKCKITLFEAEFTYKEKNLRGTIVVNRKFFLNLFFKLR